MNETRKVKLSLVPNVEKAAPVKDVSVKQDSSDTTLSPAERVVVQHIVEHRSFENSGWETGVAEHFGMSEFSVKRAWAKWKESQTPFMPPGQPAA